MANEGGGDLGRGFFIMIREAIELLFEFKESLRSKID